MIYVITGQTATGKTKHALELAKKKNGELINCDSRQIYKGLNIITGKDLSFSNKDFTSWKKMNGFDIGYYSAEDYSRLWLYDIVPPEQPFSAFEYRKLVLEVIHDMEMREKTPIIVGGTYFYLQHLLYDILDTPVAPNTELRKTLHQETTAGLQQILFTEATDVFLALSNSEKNNRQRLIRKIEVIRSGMSIHSPAEHEYDYASPFTEKTTSLEGFYFGDRSLMNEIIHERINSRMKEGAVEEVKQLLTRGYTGSEPGLQTIGYTQIIKYLKGELSEKEMLTEWQAKERQYAKRQYTFAKRDPHIVWIEV